MPERCAIRGIRYAVFAVAAVVLLATVVVRLLGVDERTSAVLAVVTCALGLALAGAVFSLKRQRRLLHQVRMTAFARIHGLAFMAVKTDPQLLGHIFNVGSLRCTYDFLEGAAGSSVVFGNHTYVTGSGTYQTLHKWGFFGVHLATRQPHALLVATANEGAFARSVLRLPLMRWDKGVAVDDPRFVSYFNAADRPFVAEFFSAELRSLLAGACGPLDAELIDDWLFVYRPARLDPLDPATFKRLSMIAQIARERVSLT